MDAREYVNVVGRAARTLARLELKRNRLRRELRQLDTHIRDAKRTLRLVAQAVDPYERPSPGAQAALDDAELEAGPR